MKTTTHKQNKDTAMKVTHQVTLVAIALHERDGRHLLLLRTQR